MYTRVRRRKVAAITVVPYIDVMLVLLIIFMVTAPMLTQGIKVDLPKLESSPVKTEKNQEPIIVSIDSNGAYYLEMSSAEGKPLELADLVGKVQAMLEQKPGTSVLLRGDKHVEYGAVVGRHAVCLWSAASGLSGQLSQSPGDIGFHLGLRAHHCKQPGQAPARQAAIFAGIGDNVPCTTVNKVCASGMKSISLGAQSIMTGDNDCVVAGGMENMSMVPHYYDARSSVKLGNVTKVDGMIRDGLWDV